MKTIDQTSAGGIIFRKEKEFLWLICRHSEHKGWVFPKGIVADTDRNETKEAAALREVREEGGVVARIIKRDPIITRYQYIWNGDMVRKTVYYYLMEYVSGDPDDHDWEMSDAKFATAEEVLKTLTYKSDREAFEKIITNYGT